MKQEFPEFSKCLIDVGVDLLTSVEIEMDRAHEVMRRIAYELGQEFGGQALYFSTHMIDHIRANQLGNAESAALSAKKLHREACRMPASDEARRLIDRLVEIGVRELSKLSLLEDQVTRITIDMAIALIKGCEGGAVYVPRFSQHKVNLRDEEIVSRFNGRNVKELARAYNLSLMRVYSILRKARTTHQSKGQAKPGSK
jgi:Mor family transcriptional regulator